MTFLFQLHMLSVFQLNIIFGFSNILNYFWWILSLFCWYLKLWWVFFIQASETLFIGNVFLDLPKWGRSKTHLTVDLLAQTSPTVTFKTNIKWICLIDTLLFCKYSSHFRSLRKAKRKPLWTHWLYCVRTILQVEKTTQISIQRGYLQNGKWNKNWLLELVPNILWMIVVKFN